jgi:HEAT repeat protein
MHAHRYCHLRQPGSEPQGWHKDDYVFDQNVRHHRGRWVMAFYYPQAVTEDMGPTAIAPGRQHHDSTAGLGAAELGVTGAAGTVTIVHFDSWHRAQANSSQRNRYMLKFQFLRMEEPAAADTPGGPPAAVANHVWHWLHGAQPATNGSEPDVGIEALADEDDDRRLQAVYAIAGCGENAVGPLVDAVCAEAAQRSESKLATSPANPVGGNPADLSCAQALAAVGVPALEALVDLSRHDHWAVRATAVDVLGTIGRPAAAAAPALQQALTDTDPWVRRNAAEALGTIGQVTAVDEVSHALKDDDWRVRLNAAGALARMGPGAAGIAPELGPLLEDPNRYVGAAALTALRRLGSPEAGELLLRSLLTSRWCPLTSPEDMY